MLKVVTLLVLYLSSMVAELEVVKSLAEEKQEVKKKNLFQNINHPQLLNIPSKKLDNQ